MRILGTTLLLVVAALTVGWAAAPPRSAGEPAADSPRKPVVAPVSLPERLMARIDFKGVNDPKTTLGEALQLLEDNHGITFEIKEIAFKYEMFNDVAKAEIAHPNPIRPMKASLKRVLETILARVTVPSGATYLLRNDHIEITTGTFQAQEIPTNRLRRPLPDNPPPEQAEEPDEKFTVPLVHLAAQRASLEDVVRQLREQSDSNIVIHPDVGAKAQAPLTLTLLNTPLDSALHLLADLAEVDFVWLDNVFYLTTKEKATGLKAKWPRRHAAPGRLTVTGNPGGM